MNTVNSAGTKGARPPQRQPCGGVRMTSHAGDGETHTVCEFTRGISFERRQQTPAVAGDIVPDAPPDS